MNLITVTTAAQSIISRIIKKIQNKEQMTTSENIKALLSSNRENQYLRMANESNLNIGEREIYLRRYQLVKTLKRLLNEGYELTDIIESTADIAIELDLHETCTSLEEAANYSENQL